jgi:membrane protein implicated in regulation of membrane protease activity
VTAPAAHSERSLIDLFRELSQQAYTLIRQEVALAKTEVNERASAMMTDAIWIGAGALLINLAFGTGVAAIVLALGAAGMPLPTAAALVAVVLLAIGGFVVQSRVSAIRRRRVLPTRAVEEIKETGQWLKDQTN